MSFAPLCVVALTLLPYSNRVPNPNMNDFNSLAGSSCIASLSNVALLRLSVAVWPRFAVTIGRVLGTFIDVYLLNL